MNKIEILLEKLIQINSTLSDILSDIEKKSNDVNINYILKNAWMFFDIRKKIRYEFAKETNVVIKNKTKRKYLNKIMKNKQFKADIIINSYNEIAKEKINLLELDSEEIDKIAWDEVHSWLGINNFVEDLIEIGILVSNVDVPKNLKEYISNARHCYGIQSYNAVYSMCRTILESAMRDIGVRTKKIELPKDELDFYKEYPPRKLINCMTKRGIMRKRIHDLYTDLSSLIHGFRKIEREAAKRTLKKTLVLTQKLYEYNMPQQWASNRL